MATERAQRRLTTILAADVVGFSRMVRADEEANPGFQPGRVTLALCFMALGRIADARAAGLPD